MDKGLFTGHEFGQLGLQFLDVASYVVFTLVVSWIIWSVLGAIGGGLRVEEHGELGGLDISEHGMEAYPEFVSTSNV
jgi:Amt family ammonium transporter